MPASTLLLPLLALAAGPVDVYVGTYTDGTESQGIYRLALDPETGQLEAKGLAADGVKNPSFLAFRPDGRFLYAVAEVSSFQDEKTGAVVAFAVEKPSGKLRKLNEQSSGGAGPCHLAVDRPGKHVLVANYTGGSVALLPIGDAGKLEEPSAISQHGGNSVNKRRQEGPHAHAVELDAANKIAVAADLGLDKLVLYRFDPEKHALRPHDPPYVEIAPGSGPRHFAFHPDGRHAYTNNEISSTVTAFAYDPDRGTLETLQTVPTLPADFDGSRNSTAEIAVHPSGRFLYVSNRGHDSIAAYTIDPETGRLTPAGHTPTGGKNPRNFALDPTGRFLLAANQDSDSVVAFRIDEQTGQPEPTGSTASVPKPVCLVFPPRPR